MSFKETEAALASGFFSLSGDGDSETVIFIHEPVPMAAQFQTKVQRRAVFPLSVNGEIKYWPTSKRTVKAIQAVWNNTYMKACTVTRVGGTGDQNTTYLVQKLDNQDGTQEPIKAIDMSEVEATLERFRQTLENPNLKPLADVDHE